MPHHDDSLSGVSAGVIDTSLTKLDELPGCTRLQVTAATKCSNMVHKAIEA